MRTKCDDFLHININTYMKNNFYHSYKDEMYEAAEAILKGAVTEATKKTIKATIYDEGDKEISVIGEYTPSIKGSKDAHGQQMEPDDEAEIEILSAKDENGDEVELSDKQEEKAKEALWDACEGIDEKLDYSAKKAHAGKDIGKPGKTFKKIADKAAKEYGSKEAGERVAGAVLAKLRKKNESLEETVITKSYSVNQSDKEVQSIIKKLKDIEITPEVQDYLPGEKGCDIVIIKPIGVGASKKIKAIEMILGESINIREELDKNIKRSINLAIAEKYIPSLGFKNADEAINNAYNTFAPTSNLAKSIIKEFGKGYTDDFAEIHDHIDKALDIWDNVKSEIMDKD